MTIDNNKAIARRFIEEIFVRRDHSAVDELVAVDFTPHDWGGVAKGRQAMRGAISGPRPACQRLRCGSTT